MMTVIVMLRIWIRLSTSERRLNHLEFKPTVSQAEYCQMRDVLIVFYQQSQNKYLSNNLEFPRRTVITLHVNRN